MGFVARLIKLAYITRGTLLQELVLLQALPPDTQVLFW